MRPPLCFCVYKNTKIQSRESALPFFSFPLLLHLVIHTPMSQTAFYYVPFHHLGCPISPFGISHFTIWDVPFCHLGCPILPFGIYFRLINHNAKPRCTDLSSSFFAVNLCVFFRFIKFSSEFIRLDKIYFIILFQLHYITMARYKEYGYDIKDGMGIIPEWEMEI